MSKTVRLAAPIKEATAMSTWISMAELDKKCRQALRKGLEEDQVEATLPAFRQAVCDLARNENVAESYKLVYYLNGVSLVGELIDKHMEHCNLLVRD